MSGALVLRPMDAAQTAAYRRQVLDGYIAQQVEFGGFTADEAHERARASLVQLWPDEELSEGHHLWNAAVDNEVVGWLWLAERTPDGPEGHAWVYDIEIHESARGREFGRALVEAACEHARAFGCSVIGLNVFGGNDLAIGLYKSLGFRVQTQQMRLEL